MRILEYGKGHKSFNEAYKAIKCDHCGSINRASVDTHEGSMLTCRICGEKFKYRKNLVIGR